MNKEINKQIRTVKAEILYNQFEEYKEKYVERICIDYDHKILQLISKDGFTVNIHLNEEEEF